jgi:hypothetical protein
MSTLDDDLALVATGELSRDELIAAHGDGADQLLDLHEHLSQLSTIEIEPPPWYVIGPQLGVEPLPVRRRKRSVVAGIAAALVLIPATAEGIEAIAPEAVEGTVIDRITDVLPWDEDTPSPTTERPADRETDAPVVVDGSDEPVPDTEQPSRVDRVVDTDRTTTTAADRDNLVDRLPDRRRDIDPADLTPEQRERLRERGARDLPTTTESLRGIADDRSPDIAPTSTIATTTTSTTAADRVDDGGDRRGD